MKQYLGVLDVAFTDELTFIERNPTKDLSVEAYASLESERRSKQLFALLSSLIERIMDKYERSSSKKLDDDFKSSIFLRSVSNNMRNHLATVLNEDVTYSTLRETALLSKG